MRNNLKGNSVLCEKQLKEERKPWSVSKTHVALSVFVGLSVFVALSVFVGLSVFLPVGADDTTAARYM